MSADHIIYDLFVIGAGSGGLAAAKRAASYGARVAIAEESLVGGTCVVRGCIPKKLMVYASRFSHLYNDAIAYGWEQSTPVFHWSKLVDAIDQEIRRLSTLHVGSLEKVKVELISGRAVLRDSHTITVADQTFTADKILIAVGGKPVVPSIPGVEHGLTSRHMFKLAEQPQHLAIVGGGYIGIEFAGIMHGLGSRITQIIRNDGVLIGFDEELRSHLQDAMSSQGVKFLTKTEVVSVKKVGTGVKLGLIGTEPVELIADAVLFATGRAPNLYDLGLENANVAIENGAIAVNDYSQTTQSNIFAVGDCTDRVNLTPVAVAEGRAFADTEFGNYPRQVSYQNIPTAVFGQPEIGTVGMTEAQARQAFGDDDIVIYRSMFRPLFNNLPGHDEKTLMKLVVASQSNQILGAHMIGKDAAEIIQMAAIAINMGATKSDFDATMALHPTTAEEFVTMR
jgi:glutathione reductase (NADPH)